MATKHIKYAGVGFRAKASPSKINRFVSGLSTKKRQSLFQVTEELKSAGLIELVDDRTTRHVHNLNLKS
jgi:hypothetical protein